MFQFACQFFLFYGIHRGRPVLCRHQAPAAVNEGSDVLLKCWRIASAFREHGWDGLSSGVDGVVDHTHRYCSFRETAVAIVVRIAVVMMMSTVLLKCWRIASAPREHGWDGLSSGVDGAVDHSAEAVAIPVDTVVVGKPL